MHEWEHYFDLGLKKFTDPSRAAKFADCALKHLRVRSVTDEDPMDLIGLIEVVIHKSDKPITQEQLRSAVADRVADNFLYALSRAVEIGAVAKDKSDLYQEEIPF